MVFVEHTIEFYFNFFNQQFQGSITLMVKLTYRAFWGTFGGFLLFLEKFVAKLYHPGDSSCGLTTETEVRYD